MNNHNINANGAAAIPNNNTSDSSKTSGATNGDDKGGNGDGANADAASLPIHRKITTIALAAAAAADAGISGVVTTGDVLHTDCTFMVGRHVITLDSAPVASGVAVTKSLEYTSPVGSCSVAETTKGTYESYECSNRGACDGKSGLCTCYEGYSGQSCQTQTVLV